MQYIIGEFHVNERIEKQTYDKTIYIEGDFTASHNAAINQVQQCNKYNLYHNNCVENSMRLINATIPTFNHDIEMYRLLLAQYQTMLIPMEYAIPNIMHSVIENYLNTKKRE